MAKHRVEIKNGRNSLEGRLFVPQQPIGSAVLFVHGFGSNGRTNEQYAKQASQRGVTSLTFDLGGHGYGTENNNDLSVNHHLEDANCAYDLLSSSEGVDSSRIGIAGMSYGGYLAILLSVDKVAKSLLLRSPPLYPHALRYKPRREYTEKEALRTDPDANNPAVAAIRGFTGKVLLVVSEHDSVVPTSITDVYKDNAFDLEEVVLPGAQHKMDGSALQLLKPMVLEWAMGL